MSSFLHDLRIRATKGRLRTIIFPEAEDDRILEAANILTKEKIAKTLLVCTSKNIERIRARGFDAVEIEEKQADMLEKLLLELRASKIGTKDELTSEMARSLARDPLMYGMYLLRLGKGDGLVAGAVRTTADVIRAGLWLVGKAKGIQTISSSFYMLVPAFRGGNKEEVLTFADCGVVKHPTAEQLADIAIAAADARKSIVGDEPLVAILSYSTKGSGGDGPTIKIIRDALALVKKNRPSIKIEGELQADAALIEIVSVRKISGESAIGHGKANVLVFPDLDAGNIAYKLVERLVPGAKAIGPVGQGFAKPVNDLSRGARTEDIVHSALIAALQATKIRK